MTYSKSVINQVPEIQVIIHEIHDEEMTLSESFQVAAINEKLPHSRRTSRTISLSSRKESMTIEDLIVKLCMKEDNI